VPAGESQRQYTVRVNAGQKQAQDEVTVSLHAPVVTVFGAGDAKKTAPPARVAALDPVMLYWRTEFAAQAYLQTPAQGTPRQVSPGPAGSVEVVPGNDLTANWVPGDSIPATADYTLTAVGYAAPATATVSLALEPVGIAYFKYQNREADGTLSGFTWRTDPPDWTAVEIQVSTDPYTFTVHQPGGGSVVAYLGAGAPQPQVQYFKATPGEGGAYVLDWVTRNVASLTLAPDAYTVPAADVAQGTRTVTPAGRTRYVLTATSSTGEVVTSTLVVDPGA
jgi:hypothetical protein